MRGNTIENQGYLASERDTIRGGQLKIGYIFDVYNIIYIWIVCMPLKRTCAGLFVFSSKKRLFGLTPSFFWYYSCKLALPSLKG